MYIREAEPSDVDTIFNIGRQSYIHHFSSIWSPQGIEDHIQNGFSPEIILKGLRDEDSQRWFLASDNCDERSQPIGFATVCYHKPIPNTNQIGMELQKLYFRSEFTGRGCGGKMMDHVIAYARQLNYSILWLDVLKSNTGGQRFYLQYGFQQVGELEFNTDLQSVGQYVMAKTL